MFYANLSYLTAFLEYLDSRSVRNSCKRICDTNRIDFNGNVNTHKTQWERKRERKNRRRCQNREQVCNKHERQIERKQICSWFWWALLKLNWTTAFHHFARWLILINSYSLFSIFHLSSYSFSVLSLRL